MERLESGTLPRLRTGNTPRDAPGGVGRTLVQRIADLPPAAAEFANHAQMRGFGPALMGDRPPPPVVWA